MHIDEVREYSFYQFPKWLLEEPYNHLSDRAKLMYMLLFDRRSLSQENNWVDDEGQVYMYFTNEQFMAKLGCSKQSVIKTKKELFKNGLLHEKQQGVSKPNRLYIKGSSKNRLLEVPELDPRSPNNRLLEVQNVNFKGSKNRLLEVQKIDAINTEYIKTDNNKTEYSNTDVINDQQEEKPLRAIAFAIRQNWGRDLTPIELESLEQMLGDYPAAVVSYAVKEATLRNKRHLKWVDSACRDWYVYNQLETEVAIQEYLTRPKAKGYQGTKDKPSNVPDWSNPDYKAPDIDSHKVAIQEDHLEDKNAF